MNAGAIITGDIVDSTRLSMLEREEMLAIVSDIPRILSPYLEVSIEIFRGDSFQIGIPNAEKALRCAIAIRAWLRGHRVSPLSKYSLDARIAIGIGTLDFQADRLGTSDGEAFRLSGRTLDNMGRSRLKIRTPWQEVNDELDLSTAFADNIITSWSSNQSAIMVQALLTKRNHSEIANRLAIARQMVDKSLKASKEELISAYITRFEKLISKHIVLWH